MTTKQIAEQLHCNVKTLVRNARKCLPDKTISRGKAVLWTKPELTILLDYMKKNNNRTDLTSTTVVEAATTSLTPSLRMIEAFKMFQDAANDEIERLKSEKNALENKNNELQIELDESKEWYSVKRMEKLNPGQKFSWKLLKSESRKLGFPVRKVFDQNYGEVNAYHISVWESLYFDTLSYEG